MGNARQCAAVGCRVLRCVTVCCSVLQRVVVCHGGMCNARQCTAVCCRVLPYVAVCCSVFRCVAWCCKESQNGTLFSSDVRVLCVWERERERERVCVCVCAYEKIHRVCVRFYIVNLLNIF